MVSQSREDVYRALHLRDPEESANAVKDVVCNQLGAVDRRARVFKTQYFNHTYFPDLVVEWPGDKNATAKLVFLRSTQSADEIRQDIVEQDRSNRLFIHLNGLGARDDEQLIQQSDRSIGDLSAAATEQSVLVAEVGTFRNLTHDTDSLPAQRILGPSVLRSGRGLLEESGAASVASTVSRGFLGAMEADRVTTSAALAVIDDILQPAAAREITSILEGVWQGAGGNPLEFPGPVHELGSEISPTRLLMMLEVISSANAEFWKKVGKSVGLQSFEGLNLVGDQPALQFIMQTASAKLTARTCRVLKLDNQDARQGFRWEVQDGILSVEGAGKKAWVATRKKELPVFAESDGRPTIAGLARRASSAGVGLRSVTVAGDGRTLSYGSDDNTNIEYDDMVERLQDALGAAAQVVKAIAVVDEDRELEIDFKDRFSTGHIHARYTLRGLISATWGLLDSIPHDELDRLIDILVGHDRIADSE